MCGLGLQDFRTGYLTLTSGRSMVAAQLLGSLIGCIVAPLTFMMFWNAFPIQEPGELAESSPGNHVRALRTPPVSRATFNSN